MRGLSCEFTVENVLRKWESVPAAPKGENAPFALFSYYAPTSGTYNAGDFIQTLAVRQALEAVGAPCGGDLFVPRDELALYRGEPVRCVMQGWFSETRTFWPSPAIRPIFIGTHFTVDAADCVMRLLRRAPEINRTVEIGCRDLSTLAFCRKVGIRSYLSRCLTLTFPARTVVPSDGETLLVDVPDEYLPRLPASVREHAVRLVQRELTGDVISTGYSPARQMEIGGERLSHYRQRARMVVTTAIHVAMPCLAFGIPTVFIEGPQGRDPTRYSALSGIVPINSREDLLSGKVDFDPSAPDISELKKLLLANLRMSIAAECGESVDSSALEDVRADIAGYKAG